VAAVVVKEGLLSAYHLAYVGSVLVVIAGQD